MGKGKGLWSVGAFGVERSIAIAEPDSAGSVEEAGPRCEIITRARERGEIEGNA